MRKIRINMRIIRRGDFFNIGTNKLTYRFHYIRINNMEVIEILSLVGLVGYLDRYWDLQNGEA